MSAPRCWLWPDRVIGKKESRVLREEHNALCNSHAELVKALDQLQASATWAGQMIGDIPEQSHFRQTVLEARSLVKANSYEHPKILAEDDSVSTDVLPR